MDIWGNIKSLIPSGLGFLANAVIPGSGGFAASVIADALGCDDEPQAINAALGNLTPEQQATLKAAAMAHKEKLMEIAHANDKMYLADRADARARQTASEQATGKQDINLYVLAWTVILGFFGLVGFLIFYTVPADNLGPVNQLFGAIAAGFGMVLSYFFGSSKSSSDKTSLLARSGGK